MKRPILIAVIGYIIGILWGLYTNVSIALFYFAFYVLYFIFKRIYKRRYKKFKLLSFHRYSRYVKLIVSKRILIVICLISVFSNTVVLFQNKKYETLYKENENLKTRAIITSLVQEKEYYNRYSIKITSGDKEKVGTNLFIQIAKKKDLNFEVGDEVFLEGTYQKPAEKRNYRGFDYQQYLKSKKKYGTIKVISIKKDKEKQGNLIFLYSSQVSKAIRNKIDMLMKEKEAAFLKGLLLGDTSEIEDDIKENFQIANISHILAISGLHISYLILAIKMLLEKRIGKRNTRIVILFVLFFYCFMTGFSPSIIRASLMNSMLIFSHIFNRKNDVATSLSISLLVILIDNPFSLMQMGLQFSYLGTIGIFLITPTIKLVFRKRRDSIKKYSKIRLKFETIIQKIEEVISVSLASQIAIFPLLIYHFNIFGIYAIVSNLLISFLIGPLLIFSFLMIIASFFIMPIANIMSYGIMIMIQTLFLIGNISNFPFAKIYLPTPNELWIILYYIIIFISIFVYQSYQVSFYNMTAKRIRNLIALFIYYFKSKKNKYIAIIIIIVITAISIIFIFPKDLKIYFIDVGQGDSTLIVTPQNRKILIDGGGSMSKEFDVGKSTVLPYLLDRGITFLDFIVISHFDQDHVGGLITVMKELQVKNVIIGKQFESSKNYQEFIKIIKEKKIKAYVVEAGQKIKIDKDLYFDILWPDSKNAIMENSINNNSLVCKLVYNNFSVLFTGDIEEIAEKAILEKYKDTNILQATKLKVAHHGSKSSSTEGFLNAVKPKIVMIGVGEKNTFGHPNIEVLERLRRMWE